MTSRRRRLVTALGVAAATYVATYVWYRSANAEVWVRDGRTYVIFGSRMSYYLYRPLTYLDRAVTGIGFHIGPHR